MRRCKTFWDCLRRFAPSGSSLSVTALKDRGSFRADSKRRSSIVIVTEADSASPYTVSEKIRGLLRILLVYMRSLHTPRSERAEPLLGLVLVEMGTIYVQVRKRRERRERERERADADEGCGKGRDERADQARVLLRLPVPLDGGLLRDCQSSGVRPLDAQAERGGEGARDEALRFLTGPRRAGAALAHRPATECLPLPTRHL